MVEVRGNGRSPGTAPLGIFSAPRDVLVEGVELGNGGDMVRAGQKCIFG